MKTLNHTKHVRREIGFQIRKAREEKQLTQQALADELNLSITAYGEIERGHSNFGINHLVNIAEILKVPIASFFITKQDKLRTTKETFTKILLARQLEVKKLLDEPNISSEMLATVLLEFYETLGELIDVIDFD